MEEVFMRIHPLSQAVKSKQSISRQRFCGTLKWIDHRVYQYVETDDVWQPYFIHENGELHFTPQPAVPAYLIRKMEKYLPCCLERQR